MQTRKLKTKISDKAEAESMFYKLVDTQRQNLQTLLNDMFVKQVLTPFDRQFYKDIIKTKGAEILKQFRALPLLLLPFLGFSQVGINTETPQATLDVAGNLRVQNVQSGTGKILVIDDNGFVHKAELSGLIKCPKLENQSTPYYLLFSSQSSIPNPNNPVLINGLNWSSAGTWISNNMYYFSYTNTSGNPL